MTTEKAISQLEDLIKEAESHMTGNKFDDDIPIDDKTALEMGIQALEKQVPKKPIAKPYFYGKRYYCSECQHYICADYNTKNPYCSNCGQALDWSDEE